MGVDTGQRRAAHGAKAPASIRSRFLLLTFAIALPALIGAMLLGRDAYRFTRTQTERQLLETTRALSLVVDRQLGQPETLLRALSTSVHIQRRDWAAFDAQARAALGPRPEWIVLYDLTGRQIVNTRLPPGAPLPPIMPGTLRDVGGDVKAGRTHYCNLRDGPVAKSQILCVAYPVRVNGKVAYGLAATFEPRVLDQLLADQRLPHGWYGVIIDRNKRVLARSKDSNRYRGHAASADFTRRIDTGHESVDESVTLDGVPVLSAIARSPVSGWTFTVAMPRSELAAAVQRSLALGIAAWVVLLSIGIGIATYAARGLTRPIEQLAGDAGRLGRGEPVPVRATGIVELDSVSNTLARASSDLSALEMRLNLAKEAGRIGVWEWSGDRQWWSNSFYELMGIDPAVEPEAQIIAAMIPAEEREASLAPISAAGKGEAFDTTFRVRLPDGQMRWMTSRGRCLSLEPRRVIGICFDVTETKRLAAELAETNAALETRVAERTAERDRTWKLGRDLFAVVRMDGTIASFNPAWTEVLGWDHAYLEDRDIVELVHPDDANDSRARIALLRQGEVIERYEVRLRHRNGSWRCIAWTAVPEGGQIHAVGRDVTDERAAGEELARAQAALHEAQKLETLGQLTGGVAHDFNNLLTPIVGTLDLLKRRFVDDKRAAHLLDTAIASADRARTLVDRLLTFARRQTLRPRAVDIGELVGGMVDLIRRSLGPTVSVIADIPGDLPAAQVDPNQLELALLNLAINARDAMPDGGSLVIAARTDQPLPPDLPPGRYVSLSVTDVGEGMDAETLRRAVEPFFSTKGIGKGTGLGLSMAHGLAAQSGGLLTIASRVGFGTVVTLWLPAAGEEAIRSSAPAAAPLAVHQGHILLVDDEKDVRATTASMLAELGCTVTEASSGSEALALLRDGLDVDALISDHLMPGMVGSALVLEARRLRPGLRAMVVSGYADKATGLPDDVQRLAKPFRTADLSAELDTLLRASGAA